MYNIKQAKFGDTRLVCLVVCRTFIDTMIAGGTLLFESSYGNIYFFCVTEFGHVCGIRTIDSKTKSILVPVATNVTERVWVFEYEKITFVVACADTPEQFEFRTDYIVTMCQRFAETGEIDEPYSILDVLEPGEN